MVQNDDKKDEILKKAIEKIEDHPKISLENAVKEAKHSRLTFFVQFPEYNGKLYTMKLF